MLLYLISGCLSILWFQVIQVKLPKLLGIWSICVTVIFFFTVNKCFTQCFSVAFNALIPSSTSYFTTAAHSVVHGPSLFLCILFSLHLLPPFSTPPSLPPCMLYNIIITGYVGVQCSPHSQSLGCGESFSVRARGDLNNPVLWVLLENSN